MKRFFYIVIAIIFLISVFIIWRPKAVKVEAVTLQRGDFYETLSADGTIRAKNKQIVYAFATGNIDGLSVKLGDVVKKGQLITRLEWDKILQVRSPIDGVISKIFRDSPGPIQRGEPIFEVSDLSDLEVVADILTPDAVRLSPNVEAKILNWGGEGELHAQVSQISRAGEIKTSALGVEEERTEVRLSFKQILPEMKKKFGDNYHVDIVFIVSHDANALVVPLGALFKNGDKWAVYIIQDGRAHLKDIEITKRNDQQAIVAGGISEGDRVILFPGDKIHEGSRVKVDTSK